MVRQASSAFPDLIAMKIGKDPIAIECKYRKHYISGEEKIAMEELYYDYGLVPMLAYKDQDKTIQLINMIATTTASSSC